MRCMTKFERTVTALVGTVLLLGSARSATAACGCDKPPPPRAAIRPFVVSPDQTVTLFDSRITPSHRYTVMFRSRDGVVDWSRGRAVLKRDFADGQYRAQLPVTVGNVSLGPVQVSVFDDDGNFLYGLDDDQLTLTSKAIALHEFSETMTRDGYTAGVGADGTVYFAIDTEEVSNATTYTAFADGYPFRFDSSNVAIFNAQGFMMGLLDPDSPGLFKLTPGDGSTSVAMNYWRHEFNTYKRDHRQRDIRRSPDGEWHVDGTPHVDNYHMVVAISGMLSNGERPTPGATPPFRLTVMSHPAESSDLR
jgi:hypothetical protein